MSKIAPDLSVAHWLNVMINRIVERFQPLKIILFGSYARGEATADSDIDLLVVMPTVTSKRRKAVEIGQVLADLPVSKDIVVTTPEDIEVYGQLVGTILRPALRDGKILYERTAS
ncbi:nucleotidyltransferase domain-containing protein [Halomicronema hongdechloris]|nr:nucleotidyltransferase domain-containing protein [Halomicronema hongdechloris]